MPAATMRQLLESGVHFGHQTKRWNPKMRPYIYGARNGIYIIDLQKTVRLFREAYTTISKTVSRGADVLFVATKPQAKEIVRDEAKRSGMPYVVNRWLGGTLTNFRTILSSVARMKSLEKIAEDEAASQGLTKKERSSIDKELVKLHLAFEGIRDMEKLPGAIFVVDTIKEAIAVHEANRLGIPVVAVVDTNCDPGPVDYVVPGNDDSIRAIRLYAACIADACIEGARQRSDFSAAREKVEGDRATAAAETGRPAVAQPTFPGEGPEVIVKRPRGYYARGVTSDEEDDEETRGRKAAAGVAANQPQADESAAAVPTDNGSPKANG